MGGVVKCDCLPKYYICAWGRIKPIVIEPDINLVKVQYSLLEAISVFFIHTVQGYFVIFRLTSRSYCFQGQFSRKRKRQNFQLREIQQSRGKQDDFKFCSPRALSNLDCKFFESMNLFLLLNKLRTSCQDGQAPRGHFATYLFLTTTCQ